jgi:rfaE bifunctional protein nucleotidyltransferase chain/domain
MLIFFSKGFGFMLAQDKRKTSHFFSRNSLTQPLSPTVLKVLQDQHTSSKIVSLDQLAIEVNAYRKEGLRVVHCHGVFDLLHIGHIRYFEQARQMGDILIVTVTPDRFVDKGPHRPAFSESLRVEAIASLKCVNFVSINCWPTAEETLRLIRPDVYVKGSEFKNLEDDPTGKIALEEKVIQEIGAEIAFTEDIVFSSTNLINRYLSALPNEVNKYLELFRSRYRLDQVLTYLDKVKALKVLIIGDTIIDEYHYCETIGKSSKDPTLVLKYQSHDLFAGGILAVANHMANFTNYVDIVTVLGGKNSYEDFILSQLNEKVTPRFFIQPGANTALKRRYIDGYSFNKLLEIYDLDDSGLPAGGEDRRMKRWLKTNIKKYDLVLVTDFRHGAISDKTVKILTENASFLAVNTQSNAGNRGFHIISRYSKIDFGTIAEHELNLETRSRDSNIRPKLRKLVNKLGCRQLAVTLGRKGCAICDRRGSFVTVPSFAQNVVDRVGAGDAFLSLTSLVSRIGAPNEIVGFMGNIAGALAVEVIGNKKAIDKMSVRKYITSLMK